MATCVLPARCPDGMRHPGSVLLRYLRVLEAVKVAQKHEDTVQPVLGLIFDPSAMKNVDHDAVSMLSSFEAHSTFTDERSGQWFIEMSLMPDADADLLQFCSWHLNLRRP